jgi:hypothetical protein
MQIGDNNEYLTMRTKSVYTMYFHLLGKLCTKLRLCDIPNKWGNKIKYFVLNIKEIACRNVLKQKCRYYREYFSICVSLQ